MAAALVSLAAFTAPKSASALKIELNDAAPDRIERQRLAARGEVLPGTPEVAETGERLKNLDLSLGTPVVLRIFKEESELELWMLKGERYVKFATYPVCHWSGSLGPKLAEGDKQSPEGFYTITRRQLHRSGRWPRSLNLGFPNPYDRELLRTGSYLLIHGGCSSVGCYAMTNAVISEVFGIVEKALRAGQQHVPVHVFPFRMTQANLQRHKDSEWIVFWRNLKPAFDSFERTQLPPQISVCKGAYQVRDGSPAEVGLASGPLSACGATSKVLAAEDRLHDIVSHPFQLSALSEEEKSLVELLSSPPLEILSQRKKALTQAGLSINSYRRRSKTGRAQVTVSCDLRRPSCRRFLALKRKRVARKASAGKRRGKRSLRAASRRR